MGTGRTISGPERKHQVSINMARTKLTSRKTTGGKAKQFASKASGKSANVNSIVKKAALSPSLKTLISVEKLTHKQVFNALKDNNEIDANLQETIYEGRKNLMKCMDLENEDDKNNNHKKKEKASLQKKTWKPILGRKNLQLAAGHPRITDDYEKDLPEYEKNRLCTIEEEKKLFDKVKTTALVLIPNAQTTVYIENFEGFLQKDIKADCFANSKPNKKRKKVTFEEGENVFYEDLEPYSPMKKSRIDDSEDTDKIAAIPKQRRPAIHRRVDPNADLKPEDITDEILDGVAETVSFKKYDTNGTSCHQCRQKTLDFKTICRSGICRGVKGNFCGVCLRNRYGQDAKKP